MKKIIFLFIVCSINLFAQEGQLKKANQYFTSANFAKSAESYASLIKEDNLDPLFLERAGDSYYFVSNFEKAAPIYKKLVDVYKKSIDESYFFKYAQTLKALNKNAESNKWMKIYDKEISETVYKANLEKLENIKNQGNKFDIKNCAINTPFSDFGPAIYNDNLVFSSPSKSSKSTNYKWNNQPYLDLFTSKIVNNEVDLAVIPFSETLNSDLHEANVTFTKDGKTIYFTRNNSEKGKRQKDKNKITQVSIYKADLVNGIWTNIQSLPFNSINYSTMHPALNKENNQLYFASDMPGTIGSFDIFYVSIDENGNFGKPTNLGPEINTKNREQFPFITNNNVLYFSSDGLPGFGLLDVFKSEYKENSFSKPLNIGLPVNTNADDFSFMIDDSTKRGFFASNRADGKGDDDIYSFLEITPVKDFQYLVQGLVKDIETQALINKAIITLSDENGKKIKEFTVNEAANYDFDITKLGTYKLSATNPDYIPAEITFTLLDNGNTQNVQNILMKAIPKTFIEKLIAEDGEPKVITDNGVLMFDLAGILFDYNKFNIRQDAKFNLNKLIDKLKRYPQININIGAHTDIRGTESYNEKLSQQRAESTKNYLVQNGIDESRITATGFGESKPKVDCTNHECSEAEHQINRRSEFVIEVKK